MFRVSLRMAVFSMNLYYIQTNLSKECMRQKIQIHNVYGIKDTLWKFDNFKFI